MLAGDRVPRIFRVLSGVLIAAFLIQGLQANRIKSPAFDETGDVASGLSYIQSGEIRANLQHPPLLKELAGISLWLAGVRLPQSPRTQQMLAGGAERAVGSELIAANGPDRVMFWARLPFLLIAAALGALLWWWGRQMLGDVAALAALVLYTFSPTILGHAYLATLDIGLAAFALLFFYALWRYLRAPGWKNLVFGGLAMGLMLCTKFSALFLLPAAAIVLVRKKQAGAFAIMGLIAVFVIQAVYLSPGGLFLYTTGLERVNADHNPYYLVYLGGEFQHSFATYFPIAYLVKEPIAAILLAALGLYLVRRDPAWYLVLPPLSIFAAHMALADDLGVRYLIPALPFLYLLGGLAVAWLLGRGTAGKVAVAFLGCWLAVASFTVAPDHLSYFNEAAGGTANGTKWLDDSNVDWGQGLKQLKQYVKDRPIKLAYFGSFSPTVYGLNAEPIEDLSKAPSPGLYVLSAHFVARSPEWRQRTPKAVVGHAMYVYEVGPASRPVSDRPGGLSH